MAFITGSAANLSSLLSALRNACTTNGWTLSGEVLHKGTSYFRVQISGNDMTILGGTGIDGSNNLTGAAANTSRIVGNFGGVDGSSNLSFPCNYYIHVEEDPDEVYLIVNYSTSLYQWMAFGKSHISLPGSGAWYAASFHNVTPTSNGITISPTAGGDFNGRGAAAFFWSNPGLSLNSATTGYIHHGLDSYGWSTAATNTAINGKANAIQAVSKLVEISPNNYNGEATLIQIPIFIKRPSTLYSIVAQPKHSRYCRVDNFDPGEIVTIGSDQWKVYPFFRKDSSSRDGGTAVTHTGTLGWAIRYTP